MKISKAAAIFGKNLLKCSVSPRPWSGAREETLQAERVTRGGSTEDHIIGMAETAKCLAMLERDLSQADAMLMEAQALGARNQVSPNRPTRWGFVGSSMLITSNRRPLLTAYTWLS